MPLVPLSGRRRAWDLDLHVVICSKQLHRVRSSSLFVSLLTLGNKAWGNYFLPLWLTKCALWEAAVHTAPAWIHSWQRSVAVLCFTQAVLTCHCSWQRKAPLFLKGLLGSCQVWCLQSLWLCLMHHKLDFLGSWGKQAGVTRPKV